VSPADAQYVPAPPQPSLPARRPAETGTAVAAALVGLAGKVWDLDGDTMGYLLVLVGALPFGISRAVDIWRGR
jgi:hypothetical protein